jgi:hypothetical protein
MKFRSMQLLRRPMPTKQRMLRAVITIIGGIVVVVGLVLLIPLGV